MKLDKVILDADFCIKLGGYEKFRFIEDVIPKISEKAYIHKYVFENEILIPKIAKDQIKYLIENKHLEILNEDDLIDEIDNMVYRNTVELLSRSMIGTIREGKNWGEVLSIAIANTLGIKIFMSDENSLQKIIDIRINTGSGNDIKVFRVEDIVNWIKEHPGCGVKRKAVKGMWVASGKSKEVFDNKIWKL